MYTIRRGLAKGFLREGGVDFLPERLRPLSKEESFLGSYDFAGRTVYDVGGNEGILTMFLARAVGDTGMVVTFEPNPLSAQRIRRHLELNRIANVRICQLALGSEPGESTLFVPPGEPGRGRLANHLAERDTPSTASYIVEVRRLDDVVATEGLPLPNLVKVDVEGFEIEVLRGMEGILKKATPDLFIEIHGWTEEQKLNRAHWLISFLTDLQYTILHVESGLPADPDNSAIASRGHIYCRRKA